MVTILPTLRQVRENLVKVLERTMVERISQSLG